MTGWAPVPVGTILTTTVPVPGTSVSTLIWSVCVPVELESVADGRLIWFPCQSVFVSVKTYRQPAGLAVRVTLLLVLLPLRVMSRGPPVTTNVGGATLIVPVTVPVFPL